MENEEESAVVVRVRARVFERMMPKSSTCLDGMTETERGLAQICRMKVYLFVMNQVKILVPVLEREALQQGREERKVEKEGRKVAVVEREGRRAAAVEREAAAVKEREERKENADWKIKAVFEAFDSIGMTLSLLTYF